LANKSDRVVFQNAGKGKYLKQEKDKKRIRNTLEFIDETGEVIQIA